MQHKKIIIPFSIAISISVGLAFYFFLESKNLRESLIASESKVATADSIENYLVLNKIDSLLFDGKYMEALGAYQQNKSDSNFYFNKVMEQRIAYVRQILNLKERLQKRASADSIDKEDEGATRVATPKEVRQFDSLEFALTKLIVQIQNLKRQVKEKTSGEYLVFSNSKDTKIHYVGKVVDGMANGQGVGLFETGSRYEGEWQNNMRHGEGSFYWPDGEYYVGEYQQDKRAGKGTYYWPNGEKFTGQWENNQRNGKGTFYGAEGEIVAQGSWKNDELIKVEKN